MFMQFFVRNGYDMAHVACKKGVQQTIAPYSYTRRHFVFYAKLIATLCHLIHLHSYAWTRTWWISNILFWDRDTILTSSWRQFLSNLLATFVAPTSPNVSPQINQSLKTISQWVETLRSALAHKNPKTYNLRALLCTARARSSLSVRSHLRKFALLSLPNSFMHVCPFVSPKMGQVIWQF